MVAPTSTFTNGTGTITTTGENNGLLLRLNPNMNRVTFGFRGTFTSVVVAVRGHITGLSASSYYPIPGVVAGSGLPISNPVSVALTNSTNAALTFDTTGCDYAEIWVVSGTPTSFSIDENQTLTTVDTPPLILQAQTSATTISAAQTFTDGTTLYFGTGNDIGITWDGTDLVVSQAAADSIIKWGVSGAGINHVFYGDTATYDMTWDQSNDQLIFADNAKLAIGTGAGGAGDITFSWNATKLLVAQLTANSAIDWGVSGAGIDMVFYGDTAGANMTWDQSADSLVFGAAANVAFDSTTGSKLGTATTQKIAFYNATPVVQPAANTDTTTGAAGGTTTVFLNTTFTGASGTAAFTIGGLITAIKRLGLIAP